MLDWTWTDLSVLDSQLFGQPSARRAVSESLGFFNVELYLIHYNAVGGGANLIILTQPYYHNTLFSV